MSNEPAVTPATVATVAEPAVVEQKAENVSVRQVAADLLKRGQPKAPEAPAAEHVQPSAQAEPASGSPTAATGDATTVTEGSAPTETPAKPGATETAEPDDVLSTESTPLDPKLQAKIDRRIAKEVEKREALRIENEALKEQLASAAQVKPQEQQQPILAPIPSDQPLAHVGDVQTLLKEQASAKEVKRWAEAQLDRDDITNGVQLGDKTYSKADLKAMVRNAGVMLEDHIPARYQFLQARQQAEQQALSMFGWMKDKTSPEFVAMQNAYRQYPWLNNLPDAPLVIGRQILGAQAIERMLAEQKAKTAPQAERPKPTPPASQTAVGAQPGAVRVPQSTQAQQRLQAKVEEMKRKGNVSRSDVAKILQAREQASQHR